MPTESPTHSPIDEEEISLMELFWALWSKKWLIMPVTLLFTIAAGVAAFLLPKTYKAEVVISPVSDTSSSQLSGLSSLASQFGGLASLAGISVSGDSKKSESLAVLQSEALTEKYIQDNNLLPILYKSKWDAAAKNWKDTDPEKIPTLWKANKLFKENVRTVVSNTKTGLVTLTIAWKDPVVAAKWANDIVRMTNDYQRNRTITQSEKNIEYLNDQAAKTDAVGVKQAIYTIMLTEINRMMLARGSDEYAFKVIDPAVPPEKADSPKKSLWVLGGFAVGLIFSAGLVLVRAKRE